jgi:AraC-like DNA-binding protein
MCLSESQFSRTFTKLNHGISFRRERTRVRLQVAAALLATTTRRVSDTAAEVGYSDRSTFDRAFRQHYGITPVQYRTRRGRGDAEEVRTTLGGSIETVDIAETAAS